MLPYNTALTKGRVLNIKAPPTEKWTEDGCMGRRNNLITEGIPTEYVGCDLFYSEPPFAPSGLKVFDGRAGVQTSYTDLREAFAKAFQDFAGPSVVICSQLVLKGLPEPTSAVPVMLNGDAVTAFGWGMDLPKEKDMTNLQLATWLGYRYNRAIDPCCGYAVPLIFFKQAREGNTFVAADYDAHCITVARGLMKQGLE